jgi:hypothetical protein
LARFAPALTLRTHAVQALLQLFDPRPQQAPVSFELRLTGTAQAYAAFLSLEMGPPTHQSRGQVFQLRQLDLQLAFMAASTLGEDIEDQARAVKYAATELALEVALLGRRKRVVDQYQIGGFAHHGFPQLADLASSEESPGVDTAPTRRDDAADKRARGFRQSAELRCIIVPAIG